MSTSGLMNLRITYFANRPREWGRIEDLAML